MLTSIALDTRYFNSITLTLTYSYSYFYSHPLSEILSNVEIKTIFIFSLSNAPHRINFT